MATVKEQVKEHPVIALVSTVAIIAGGGNVATLVSGIRAINSLATKEYVHEVVDSHTVEAEAVMNDLESQLRRIRAYTEVVPELRNLLALKCMGTPNLDATINRLKAEFSDLTGEPYIEPPCGQLLAGR